MGVQDFPHQLTPMLHLGQPPGFRISKFTASEGDEVGRNQPIRHLISSGMLYMEVMFPLNFTGDQMGALK